jgi:DNA-binding MarR family transcriptional regulator
MNEDLRQAADQLLNLMMRMRRLGPGTPPPEQNNISHSHVSIIEQVAKSPGRGIQEIARELDLATPTVSIGVRQLEDSGFVTRQPDPHDGRAVQLFLTPEGETLHQRTHHFRRQKFERLLEGLPPQQRTTLLNLLEQALNNTEKQA